MAIPFLYLYLTKSLGFSLENVGSSMTAFGVDSLVGNWLRGKLTDILDTIKLYLQAYY